MKIFQFTKEIRQSQCLEVQPMLFVYLYCLLLTVVCSPVKLKDHL